MISQFDDLYMFGWNESGQLAMPTILAKPAECFSAVEKLLMACCTMQPEDAALPRGDSEIDGEVYHKNDGSNGANIGTMVRKFSNINLSAKTLKWLFEGCWRHRGRGGKGRLDLLQHCGLQCGHRPRRGANPTDARLHPSGFFFRCQSQRNRK